MTKCMCERITSPLVMTRELLADTVRFNRNNERIETLDKVIDLLANHKSVWFSQSLTGIEQTNLQIKIKVIEQLQNEMEEMKCQN